MSKITDFVSGLSEDDFETLKKHINEKAQNRAKIRKAVEMMQEAKDYCQAQGLRILVGFPDECNLGIYEVHDLGARIIIDIQK